MKPENISSFELPAGTAYLTAGDRPWLEALGCEWPEFSEEDWVTEINQTIAVADTTITPDLDTATRQSIETSREFFATKVVPLAADSIFQIRDINDRRYLNKPSTIIGSARMLHVLGLDTQRIISDYPKIITRSTAHIYQVAGQLDLLGLDTVQVLNARPVIFRESPGAISERIEVLANSSVTYNKVVELHPRILSTEVTKLQKRLEEIEELGATADETVKRFPGILTLSADKFFSRISLLESYGISPVKVITRDAKLLGLSEQNISDTIQIIASLGLDTKKLINFHPSLLSLSAGNIQNKIENLKSAGLNYITLVEKHPSILAYSCASLRKKIKVLQSVARWAGVEDYVAETKAFIEAFPAVLSYSPWRIRTLARVISTLDVKPQDYIGEKRQPLINLVFRNLEATLAASLDPAEAIETVEDLNRKSNKYKKMGKLGLLNIIATHPGSLAVKTYYRGHPTSKDQ